MNPLYKILSDMVVGLLAGEGSDQKWDDATKDLLNFANVGHHLGNKVNRSLSDDFVL